MLNRVQFSGKPHNMYVYKRDDGWIELSKLPQHNDRYQFIGEIFANLTKLRLEYYYLQDDMLTVIDVCPIKMYSSTKDVL